MINSPQARTIIPAIAAFLFLSVAPAQERSAAEEITFDREGPLQLSPFVVSTARDNGYRATNAISGSRMDAAIKELPMPIEVITEDFIRDTGASNLRQSLRYSAGIILQSQNDQSANAVFGAGGVNNPEGATAAKTRTTIKLRGYLTDVVLRDGYRRQSATDAINIERIEVIRGPAALLYGIGNFGGIVNYLPKTPERERATRVTFAAGTDAFLRATVDTTGPAGSKADAAYRLTAAVQDTGDYTDLYHERHTFISPSLSFRPAPKTFVLVDLEYGEQEESAVGFLSVRARSDIDGVGQADRLQSSGFTEFPDKDIRTFRWSGPDTYRDSTQANVRVQIRQELFAGLQLLVGYNRSRVTFDTRDVQGSMEQGIGPVALRDTITVIPIDAANGSSEFMRTQTANTIFKYLWADSHERSDREQARIEMTYAVDLFAEKGRWLTVQNRVLLGRSYERADRLTALKRSRDNQFNFKRPTDATYLRFGVQGDGTPDVPMTAINRIDASAWNMGDYAVYQGKFLDGRLVFVGGVRQDKSDYGVATETYHPGTGSSAIRRPTQRERTDQYGVTFALLPQVSVYALRSGGLQPNFDGLRDATGAPLGPTLAKSREVGLKIDLLDGRISGTISRFKIERVGVPFTQWWMPALKGAIDPAKPIVYNVSNFSPSSVLGGSNGGNGAADAALPEWNAGVSAGSIYTLTVNGSPAWYVNATQATGAAYLDRVFALSQTVNPGWPGWLYNTDANTNNGWDDRGDGGGWSAYVQQEDESQGWDAQILFKPTENLQLLATYAHVRRVITNPGRFVRYPHSDNRWAPWYFPDPNWGLTGYTLGDVYVNPADTSTWTGVGWGAGQSRDDTPKHAVSGWGNYRVTKGIFRGLSLGLGGQWESEREYFSGVTYAGQKQSNRDGQLIVLKHKSRLSLDAMIRYEFKVHQRTAHVQLNGTNVLNDEDLYGLIYAPGLTVHLELGVSF